MPSEVVEQLLEEFRPDFRMLIEAGFIGVKQFDEPNATFVFKLASLLNPDHVAPAMGMGYIALNKMELKKASEIFEKILEKEPDHYLTQTFLGLCYLLSKNKKKKGEKLILDAMEKTTEPTVKHLGEVSLEWAAKEGSKVTKAPFFGDKKEEEES